MNVVDSSCWLEYFAGTTNASNFEKVIENTKKLLVPTIVIHEVFKKLLRETNEETAIIYTAQMKQGTIIDLDLSIALASSKIAVDHQLPMADSIILATARSHQATLWTQDSDFQNINDVKYFPKK